MIYHIKLYSEWKLASVSVVPWRVLKTLSSDNVLFLDINTF